MRGEWENNSIRTTLGLQSLLAYGSCGLDSPSIVDGLCVNEWDVASGRMNI